MTAILTEYYPPTNTKGARIIARSALDPRKVQAAIPYDHGESDYKAHERAATKLIEKMGWGTIENWRGGEMQRGKVWVRVSWVDKETWREPDANIRVP